jgi:ribose 5-phosphate isomerase B
MMSRAVPFRLVLLCTGNTCRSPLAAAAFREELGADAERVEVLSAGTSALDGQPASAGASAAAARAGLDLTAHRSQRPSAELLRGADLVLVMEPEHARAAAALGADPSRTHLLSEWPESGEPALAVSDPFGGSLEAYEECLGRIRRHVRRIVPRVREALRSRLA